MRVFLMGAATIALAASAAIADPGKGNGGNNKGNGGGQMAQAGGPKGGPGKGQDKPAKAAPQQAKADRGPAAGGKDKSDAGPSQRKASPAVAQRNDKAKGPDKVREVKGPARDVRVVRDVRDDRVDRRDDNDPRIVRTVVNFDTRANRGLIDGCPPGLAKKNNGCLPPGLAKNRDYRYDYRPSWFGYPSAQDGRYFYDDGYLYRLNQSNSVLGYIPLLGGALSIGNPWPSSYQPVPVPDYYTQYYNLGPSNSYRYADDVLYRVDPQTNVISSIAALLTGDQFAVGQPMPMGYDVYNVPYGYQDRYYDSPNANYRYADGYVYQVDPKTQLIAAAIQLLT